MRLLHVDINDFKVFTICLSIYYVIRVCKYRREHNVPEIANIIGIYTHILRV